MKPETSNQNWFQKSLWKVEKADPQGLKPSVYRAPSGTAKQAAEKLFRGLHLDLSG